MSDLAYHVNFASVSLLLTRCSGGNVTGFRSFGSAVHPSHGTIICSCVVCKEIIQSSTLDSIDAWVCTVEAHLHHFYHREQGHLYPWTESEGYDAVAA